MNQILQNQSQNSTGKISLILQESSLDVLQLSLRKSLNWHQLKNINFQVNQVGFFFLRNNYFLPIIDRETQQLTSAGIMNYLVNLVYNNRFLFTSEKEWKVLSIENLRFGFVIWLYSCAVTVVVFVAEVIIWIAIKKTEIRLKRHIRHEWNKYNLIYPFKIQRY